MQYHSRLSKCINTHSGNSAEFFDSAKSNSQFPAYFCCSCCEHDWVANRLQALTFANAVNIPRRSANVVSADPVQPNIGSRTDAECD